MLFVLLLQTFHNNFLDFSILLILISIVSRIKKKLLRNFSLISSIIFWVKFRLLISCWLLSFYSIPVAYGRFYLLFFLIIWSNLIFCFILNRSLHTICLRITLWFFWLFSSSRWWLWCHKILIVFIESLFFRLSW